MGPDRREPCRGASSSLGTYWHHGKADRQVGQLVSIGSGQVGTDVFIFGGMLDDIRRSNDMCLFDTNKLMWKTVRSHN